MGPDELGRLIDRHASALELYARQWCDAPEDIVQEAFLKLVEQKRPPENVAAWLFRVVRNGAINAATAARRRRGHESRAAAEAPAWFQPEPVPAREPRDCGIDPETAAEALASLPIEQREAIVAHLWGGLTFEQIARMSGASSSTAHRWYQAGLAALRTRLGATCPNQP